MTQMLNVLQRVVSADGQADNLLDVSVENDFVTAQFCLS